MIQKPFLLDPNYEGTLDSGEFRRRFEQLNVRNPLAGWRGALPMYLLAIVIAAFGLYGKLIRGTQTRLRDDLLNEPLPAPGTPFAVLVVDETTHVML
jgi:hypothetical protein